MHGEGWAAVGRGGDSFLGGVGMYGREKIEGENKRVLGGEVRS